MSGGLLDEKDCQPLFGMVELQSFPNTQFHYNSDGDADGSSVSEESYVPEDNVHIHAVEFPRSHLGNIHLCRHTPTSLAGDGIKVNPRVTGEKNFLKKNLKTP